MKKSEQDLLDQMERDRVFNTLMLANKVADHPEIVKLIEQHLLGSTDWKLVSEIAPDGHRRWYVSRVLK